MISPTGVRPSTPFPRPQAPQQPRAPGIFQQRSVPQLISSPQQPLSRGNTVDYPGVRPENVTLERKPSLESLKNKSFSMSSASVDPQNVEERRYSISSVDENKQMHNNGQLSRPESRTDGYMNKIIEDMPDQNRKNEPIKEEITKTKHEETAEATQRNGAINDNIKRSPTPLSEKPPAKITEDQIPKPTKPPITDKDYVIPTENVTGRPVPAGKHLISTSNENSAASEPAVPSNEKNNSKTNEQTSPKSSVNIENKHVKETKEGKEATVKTDRAKPAVPGRTATPDLKIPIKSKTSKKTG